MDSDPDISAEPRLFELSGPTQDFVLGGYSGSPSGTKSSRADSYSPYPSQTFLFAACKALTDRGSVRQG